MFVLNDSFQSEQSRKGREPWTRSSDDGKEKAEDLFTMIGFAHRKFEPLFAEKIFPAASKEGMTTYAQAIVYNANPQKPGQGNQQKQPLVGWDTLNWDPDSTIPEWGALAREAAVKWPWEIFDMTDTRENVRVKLNWQAKLMPVTSRRLKAAAEEVDGDMQSNVKFAAKHFEKVGNQ
jgi:hypothetical protein